MKEKTKYPINLLDKIAGDKWEYDIPDDINATIAYIAAELPEKLQEIFELRYKQGKSRAETARILNSTSEKIRRQEFGIHRIFRQIPNIKLLRKGVVKTIEDAEQMSADSVLTGKIKDAVNAMTKAAEVLTKITEKKTEPQTPLDELNLPVNITAALKRGKIYTVEALAAADTASLMKIRKIGEKNYAKITDALREYFLSKDQ